MKPVKLCIGDDAPPFTLTDTVTNKEVSLSEFVGKDTFVIFFRGTWCPFCREQMTFLRRNHATLQQAGIAVVGIVCQSPASVRNYLAQNPLPFPMLVDSSRSVAKAYGTHYWVSPEGINLAQPSLFILDRAQKITYAHVGRNMRDLPVTYVVEKFIGMLPADSSTSVTVPPA